jgi:hypothetical protein
MPTLNSPSQTISFIWVSAAVQPLGAFSISRVNTISPNVPDCATWNRATLSDTCCTSPQATLNGSATLTVKAAHVSTFMERGLHVRYQKLLLQQQILGPRTASDIAATRAAAEAPRATQRPMYITRRACPTVIPFPAADNCAHQGEQAQGTRSYNLFTKDCPAAAAGHPWGYLEVPQLAHTHDATWSGSA